MSNDSVEVQLARIDERMKVILQNMELDRGVRKQQYEKMEEIGINISELNSRVGVVERGLADSAPTIEEFITIKHKVAGAGAAGRWVWLAGSVLVGILFTIRKELIEWLSK